MSFTIQNKKGTITLTDNIILQTVTKFASYFNNHEFINASLEIDNDKRYYFFLKYRPRVNNTMVSEIEAFQKQMKKSIETNLNLHGSVVVMEFGN